MSRRKAICKEVKNFLRERNLSASKERRQSTAGTPRGILDLDVDLFPLPAKYYSLKIGIEILFAGDFLFHIVT